MRSAREVLDAPTWQLLDHAVVEADCVAAMACLADGSVDAVVCDPPYGLEFMGKDWDSFKVGRSAAYAAGGSLHDPADRRGKGGAGPNYTARPAKRCATCGKQAWSGSPCECPEPEWVLDNSPLHAFQAWCEAWAHQALRVLKPGGHLVAFGGTRTYHRLVAGVEDAGFEVRDQLAWLFGSGFPKSLDVGKAIAGQPTEWDETLPHTSEAERWEGWGTALKPGHEPIVLARKPLAGTVAANVLEHGTGALNVDGCRIEGGERPARTNDESASGLTGMGGASTYGSFAVRGSKADGTTDEGRWPANVVLDPDAAAMLDEQAGDLRSGANPTRRGSDKTRDVYSAFEGQQDCEPARGADSGGASRFFYCAKTSSAERNAGLDGFDPVSFAWGSGANAALARGEDSYDAGPGIGLNRVRQVRNTHPTVKPIDLMRWLVRLVTPPGGLVLDPFAGSGTTGAACALEGLGFVGVERDAGYVELARARVTWWREHLDEGRELMRRLHAAERRAGARGEAGQMDLFGGAAPASPPAPPPPAPTASPPNGRDGEPSAERRYTDSGASDFAMRPGRRRR